MVGYEIRTLLLSSETTVSVGVSSSGAGMRRTLEYAPLTSEVMPGT